MIKAQTMKVGRLLLEWEGFIRAPRDSLHSCCDHLSFIYATREPKVNMLKRLEFRIA